MLTQQKTAQFPAHFKIKPRLVNARSFHKKERPKDDFWTETETPLQRQGKSQSWDLTLPKAVCKNYRLEENSSGPGKTSDAEHIVCSNRWH